MKKLGIVVLASRFESGGERSESLIKEATLQLEARDITTVASEIIVYSELDALRVIQNFKDIGIDALILIDATWVADSLKYLFFNMLKRPTIMWAVPYLETFSLACVQHMNATLKSQAIHTEYVYGLPSEENVIEDLMAFIKGAFLVQTLKESVIALVGPRQTWRVAASQDITNDEWHFSNVFGTSIIHLEMDEILSRAKHIEIERLSKRLNGIHHYGKVEISDEQLIDELKRCEAIIDVFKDYKLFALAAECYPQYSGLLNVSSSLLSSKGMVVDTEGDISHALLLKTLNILAGNKGAILGEVVDVDRDNNRMVLAHEGSTGDFAAEKDENVHIFQSGPYGSFVGLPVKTMDTVTVANITGVDGQYKMFIASGATKPVSQSLWDEAGQKMVMALEYPKDVQLVFNKMISCGVDHHLVVVEGDYTKELSVVCNYLGIEKTII